MSVALYCALLLPYLPNESGRWGHDYAYFLPGLLDGFYWFDRNGPFAIPWFTPAFCGGLPKFPNPQALYFSAPQWLSFAMAPTTAVRITLVLFAGLGWFGAERLLRRRFAVSPPLAALGATLFLTNGVFAARMLVGHLTFHGFMAVPWLAHFALPPLGETTPSERRGRGRLAGGAVVLAYLAATSAAHTLLQAIVAVIGLAAIAAWQRDAFDVRAFVTRGLLAGVLAIGLSAAKLVAAIAYVGEFPRTLYPLPGVESPLALLGLIARALFGSPPVERAAELVVRSPWRLGEHEWDYGVSPVPLGLLALALFGALGREGGFARFSTRVTNRVPAIAVLGAVVGLPFVLNLAGESWSAWLESLPVLGSSSSLFRWFSIYVPLLCFAPVVGVDAVCRRRAPRLGVAALGFFVLGAHELTSDRSHYAEQGYDPTSVVRAHQAVAEGRWVPRLEGIEVKVDARGREVPVRGRNDSLSRGRSQLLCYETLFGFRLERFPRGELHAGPFFGEPGGPINLKDPSCFVYPDENGCTAGDPFPVGRRADAEAFVAYRPFPFERPGLQRAAEIVSAASWLGLLAMLVAEAVRARRARASGP